MAELNIGAHCSFKECNQLDFLPIKCQKCSLMFCKVHSVDYQHMCLFSSNVSVEVSEKDSLLSGYECNIDDCLVRELIMIVCDKCNRQTCLRHRLPEDHSCEGFIKSVKTNASKLLSIQVSGTELQNKFNGVNSLTNQGTNYQIKHNSKIFNPTKKASKTLTQVMQMKMKMNSIGNESVPLSERIYLNVFYQSQCKPLYFSKDLSMGRALDQSARLFNLKNENHLAFSKKLIFCTLQNKKISLDIKIEDAIQNGYFEIFGDIFLKYE